MIIVIIINTNDDDDDEDDECPLQCEHRIVNSVFHTEVGSGIGRSQTQKFWMCGIRFGCCILTGWWGAGLAVSMMTSSNGNIIRVTGPLWGKFTGDRWIPLTKPVTGSFDVFFDLCLDNLLSKQSWRRWFETPSCALWRPCNVRNCLNTKP